MVHTKLGYIHTVYIFGPELGLLLIGRSAGTHQQDTS